VRDALDRLARARATDLRPLRALAFPGIYVLERDGTPVYVGQSNDIAERLGHHAGRDDLIFDAVRAVAMDDEPGAYYTAKDLRCSAETAAMQTLGVPQKPSIAKHMIGWWHDPTGA
jgi:hypothetical protein